MEYKIEGKPLPIVICQLRSGDCHGISYEASLNILRKKTKYFLNFPRFLLTNRGIFAIMRQEE